MINRSLLVLGALALGASTGAAQGRVVTLTTSDFRFDAPDSVAAGVTTFELVNKGPELHHVQFVRLDDGKTLQDFQQAMASHGPPPAWVKFVGGPNTPIPDGKSVSRVTMDLAPGQYVLLCFIPSADGTPHVAKGMVRPLVVTGSAASVTQAGVPKADVVMTLYDYNFDLDKPLTAGRRTIRIYNKAQQFHEAVLVKLNPGASLDALPQWLSTGMKGPPPAVPMGGVVGIDSGRENYITVDLVPGEYALYCFLPAPDGKEHVVHGMLKKVIVTN